MLLEWYSRVDDAFTIQINYNYVYNIQIYSSCLFLSSIDHIVPSQIEALSRTGVDEDELKEFTLMFKHFDKDRYTIIVVLLTLLTNLHDCNVEPAPRVFCES